MRSRGVVALLLACIAGAAALAIAAAADERTFAFTPNGPVVVPVVFAQPGEEVCQRDVEATAGFDEVELRLSTGTVPAPPVGVTARATGSGRVLGAGRLPGGAADNRPVRARIAPAVPERSRFDVCLRNEGGRDVGFYGGAGHEARGDAVVGGRRVGGDVHMVFRRSEPESALSLVPDMFERAALWRPDPVGPWTFWVLLAAVAAGIPALLALALRRAGHSRGRS